MGLLDDAKDHFDNIASTVSTGVSGISDAAGEFLNKGGLMGFAREASGGAVRDLGDELYAIGGDYTPEQLRAAVVAKANERDAAHVADVFGRDHSAPTSVNGTYYNPDGSVATNQTTSGTFKPYTVTTGAGTTTFTDDGVTSNLSPELQALHDLQISGATDYTGMLRDAFDQDIAGRSSEIYDRMEALAMPQLTQAMGAMQEKLHGSRGAVGVTPETLGYTGEGGAMLQPEMFAQDLATKQALAGLAATADQQAQSEWLSNIGALQSAQTGTTGQALQTAGLELSALNPALASLVAQQNQEQWETMLPYQQAMMQAQIDKLNYQPDPLMSMLTGGMSSFMSSPTGSNWLAGLFS